MRIVAGDFRGRRLLSPKNRSIRPTSDRVREAVFSMLSPRVPDAVVLDLFAGTGALGLEALSRGAVQAVFVDESAEAVRLILQNARICAAEQKVEVIQDKVERVLRRFSRDERMSGRFHIVFLDPPYGKGLIESTLSVLSGVVAADAVVVAEHHVRDALPARLGDWALLRERKYGDTKVSFYVREIPPAMVTTEADKI